MYYELHQSVRTRSKRPHFTLYAMLDSCITKARCKNSFKTTLYAKTTFLYQLIADVQLSSITITFKASIDRMTRRNKRKKGCLFASVSTYKAYPTLQSQLY